MLKAVKNFFQRKTRGYSDKDIDFANRLFRGDKPFDVVDNASNILGNFFEVEDARDGVAKAILHASDRTISEIQFKGSFLDLFDLNATATIRQAGQVAERFADKLYTDIDPTMAMMSDAYSVVAVLCYGRIGVYEDTDRQQIFEMAAQLFGTISAVKMSSGRGDKE